MKYIIVVCVLIYFELIASYSYAEKYSKANQNRNERPQNVPPGFYYQNGFMPETTRHHFDNVGSNRPSNIHLETGSDLKPVHGVNYDNLLLWNQESFDPVKGNLANQPGFNNEFPGNQARLPQYQAQYAAVPHLNSVDKSYLNPDVRQYPPVNHVENIANAASLRPQYYPSDQNLPLMNVSPSPRTVSIQKLQNGPLEIKEINSDIGVFKKNSALDLPSNMQIQNVAGNNNLRWLLNNPKLRQILATTKNKKRYMVIHPNGEVEHLDSIEHIAAQHPNHLVFNSAAVNQIRDTVDPPSLTSSNVPPSPAVPLYSNTPPRSPAIPLKSNKSSPPTALPPQVTSTNLARPPVIPLVPNTQPSPVALPLIHPPMPASSSTTQPSNILLKSNSQSSAVVQPTTIPPYYLKNCLPSTSAVVEKTPELLPVVPPTTILQNSISNAKASLPAIPNPLPLPQQFHVPVQLVSAGVNPVSSFKSSKIDSTYPISNLPFKATPNAEPPKKTPMISTPTTPTVQAQNVSSISSYVVNNNINHISIDDSKNNKTAKNIPLHGSSSHVEPKINRSTVKDVPAKSLLLAITEVNPKLISNDHSPVAIASASENKLDQTIESEDIYKNSLTSEDKEKENTLSVELVPKPVAMVSPTPMTLSAPIDLADLFPITKEDEANKAELSNSAVTDETTESTESVSTKSDSNAIDHVQSDTNISSIEDGKQTIIDEVANVSTGDVAHEEQRDENGNDLEVFNSFNIPSHDSSPTTEIKSNAEERSDNSVNQADTQTVSGDYAQSESQAVYKSDSASIDTPSSPKKPSNTDAEFSDLKNPPIVVDTAPAALSSTGMDEILQQSSSISAIDESNDRKENSINLIEGKDNIFWFTPPPYDEIWNKLLGDGVTVMYFLQMPSQNNYENEEVNRNSESNIKTHEDLTQIFTTTQKEAETSN